MAGGLAYGPSRRCARDYRRHIGVRLRRACGEAISAGKIGFTMSAQKKSITTANALKRLNQVGNTGRQYA
jgi:hypothetical protein